MVSLMPNNSAFRHSVYLEPVAALLLLEDPQDVEYDKKRPGNMFDKHQPRFLMIPRFAKVSEHPVCASSCLPG